MSCRFPSCRAGKTVTILYSILYKYKSWWQRLPPSPVPPVRTFRGLASPSVGSEPLENEFPSRLPRLHLAFQLGVFQIPQHLAEHGPGPETHVPQVVAGQQALGANLFRRCFGDESLNKLVRFQVPMAGKAIESMQRQMLVKTRQPDEALERSSAHGLDVLEAHVVVDQREDLSSVLIRKAQSAADLLGHANTH